MGLFSKTPEEKEEKLLQKEGKNEEKNLRQALKDLERAHKAEHKAQKAEHDASEDYQKSIRKEEKLSADLIKLQHELESATANKEQLSREAVARQAEVKRLAEETKRLQATVETLQTKFRENTERRDARLEALSGSGSNTSQSSLPMSPAAGLAGVGVAGAAGAGAAGAQHPPAPAVANPEATGVAANEMSPLGGAAPGQFVEVPQASSTPPVPQGAPSLPPRDFESGGTAPLQAGAPALPPRGIDTGMGQGQPGGFSPASAQGFAPPPRHPVADATAPHQTSPINTTAPSLPARQETADTFQSSQSGYGSVPQSTTSGTAPQLPQGEYGGGIQSNTVPGQYGQYEPQVVPQAHPNLMPGHTQTQPGQY